MQKIVQNLLLALIVTLLFITVEQTYRTYNDILTFNLNLKSFLEQLLLNFLILSIISRRAILTIYSILALLVWFQLLHFGYFGTWIFPLEYYLFFTKFQETFDTFKTVLDISIVPTISIIFLLIILFKVINKNDNKRLKLPYLSLVLILFIIFIPARVYIKDSKKGHRPNVEHYPIKNTVNNLGYLLGNILPKKANGHSGLEQTIINTPKLNLNNPDINVVVIMGESLHRSYMSLYDYKIKTTPYLDTLKNDQNFIYKKGISSGVVTDVAIPSFFNMIKRPDGVPQIITSNTCLFKMAKKNGFTTHYFSAQAQGQLSQLKSYLCPSSIDQYTDGTTVTKDIDRPALDEFLIDTIDKVDFEKPNFLVLHQRGSHTPFKEDYPKEFEKFTKKTSEDSSISQNTLEYQNSVYYTDYVISKIIEKIKSKTNKPTYFIFTSDHATNIGDSNRNGHGRLDYDSIYQVPFFIYGINNPKDLSNKFSEFEYISHYQISNVISHLLGYQEVSKQFNQKEDYYVCDSDISGLAGILKLSFDENNNQIPKLIE